MALQETYMVKSDLSLEADGTFTLEAKAGESLLVKDVLILGENDSYCLFSIGRDTVGFFRLSNHSCGSHLYPPRVANTVGFSASQMVTSHSLISLLVRKGLFDGFPIAEGEKFVITPYTSGKKLGRVLVIYEKYDAGDIKSDMPNGSEAKEYIYVAYGQPSETVKSSGTYTYDTMINPEEFADFPFEGEVPAKTEIELLGITGWEVISVADGSNYTSTKYLKLFRGRKLLFDVDKKGIPMYQYYYSGLSGTVGGLGFSLLGQYSHKDFRMPLFFDTPIKFTAGEELRVSVEVEATGSGSTIDAKFLELGFILRARITE